MRKIVLFKIFEKAIIGNYPLNLVDNYNNTISISQQNLAEMKSFYYNNLDDQCRFKNDLSHSIISIIGG